MKNLFLSVLVVMLATLFTIQAFARCQYWGPPLNRYGCYPDKPVQSKGQSKQGVASDKETPGRGCNQLDLTISCAASGSAVDWVNTCSLDCGDENRYDALAVQQDETTLKCWHREVPPNASCRVSVGSGFDSKVVGTIRTTGTCKQTLRGVCAW